MLVKNKVKPATVLIVCSTVAWLYVIANLPRSCEEWLSSRGNRTRLPAAGKNVTVDLDGGGPMKPMLVTCKMIKDDMGVDVYMRFSCRGGAHLMTQGDERSPSSWYATRSEKHGLQWGDAPPYSRMCSCATNGTCLHNRMCNCDSGEDATDEGVNPYAQLLPVTGLFLGGTTKSSSIEVEIGPLICNRRGHLSLSVYDGFFFNHKSVEKRWNISDNVMHDIAFCASDTSFNLTVDGEPSINFVGNWTFFQNFNVWTFVDKTIVGLAVAGILALLLSVLVCYMRSRPEGVYKTNEGEYSPSRSEEPLVNGVPAGGKEYFC
ncbi:hypothetical protein Q1695_005199 [Nippostrongylus brasiliensis]|nr:hypothetical protein Q1695_005199 [Nippostrongylus brasiliensis]